MNDVCDPSGNGEGQTLLGSVIVTTDGSGDAVFAVFGGASVALGKQMTTTATNLTTNDTSEFSNGVEVEQAPPTPTPSPTPTATPIGETPSPTPTGPTPSPSPTPTATPSPGPSGTATPTPTATPVAEIVVWGDANCSGEANPVDSLFTLRFDAGLPTDTGDCPEMGLEIDVLNASPHIWGDVDCSGEVNPIDSLKILRSDAGLGVTQEADCPEMGQQVQITPAQMDTRATVSGSRAESLRVGVQSIRP